MKTHTSAPPERHRCPAHHGVLLVRRWLTGLALLIAVTAHGGSSSPGWEGHWPTQAVIRTLIADAAQHRCLERYALDEAQCRVVSDTIANQWSEFLTNNRDVVQPVVDEFVEMQLGPETPSKERLRRWAGRVQPVIERLNEHLEKRRAAVTEGDGSAEGIQQELNVLQLESGLRFVRHHAARWRRGEIDEREFHRPPGAPATREGRRTVSAPRVAPAPAVLDPISVELFRWARYVEQFMQRHQFDDAQRDAAVSCLAELTERATAHRDRHADQIRLLERRIETPQRTPEDKARLQADILRLYGPIDRMFAELKRRIEVLPTTAQRARAANNGGS